MKKLLLLMSLIFCGCEVAIANLCHEQEYWIAELSRNDHLNTHFTNRAGKNYFYPCFHYGNTESKTNNGLLQKSISTISKIIEKNLVHIAVVNISFDDGSLEQQKIRIDGILNALMYNTTAKNLNLYGLNSSAANEIATIIRYNKTAQRLTCDDSKFEDDGAYVIAKALKNNKTLQLLKFENSTFSMKARKKIKEAWALNKVEGRNLKIEF
jgi:hypothetical protein